MGEDRTEAAWALAARWAWIDDHATALVELARICELFAAQRMQLDVRHGAVHERYIAIGGAFAARPDAPSIEREDATAPWAQDACTVMMPLVARQCDVRGMVAIHMRQVARNADLVLAATLAPFVTATLDRVYRLRADKDCNNAFLAMLAHDMRSPLSAIATTTSALALQAAPRDAVELIERQVRYLTRMASDVGQVARFARGTITLDLDAVDVATAIERAAERVRTELQELRCGLVVDAPPACLFVLGDLDRLSYALSCVLAVGARRASTLRVTARRREERIEVKLAGAGGSWPTRRSFASAAAATSSDAWELGIQLAREILALHRGELVVRDDAIIFVLPATRLASREHPAPAASELAAYLPARRVLIVEDDRDTADALAGMLQALGSTVAIAYDGDEARAQIAAFAPDLCLIDLHLPDIGGAALAGELRACSPAKLVAVTGLAVARDPAFDELLEKPIALTDVARLLALGPAR